MRSFKIFFFSLSLVASTAHAAKADHCFEEELNELFSRKQKPWSPFIADIRNSYTVYGDTASGGQKLSPEIYRAMRKILDDYERIGKYPPSFLMPGFPHSHGFEDRWIKAKQAAQDWPAYGTPARPLPVSPVKDSRGSIPHLFEVDIDGKKWIFRELLPKDETSLRPRYAADRINQLLGIDSSSQSYFAVVNGKRGLLSSFVPGRKPLPVTNDDSPENLQKHLKTLLASGKLRSESLSDAYAYAFLINNGDVHSGNFGIDENGKLRIFDHNLAFEISLPVLSKATLQGGAIGQKLPDQYTPRFVAGIKKLTPTVILREFKSELSADEIEALIFRRAIILKDISLRGSRAPIAPKRGI